jgi:hypothetical protein
VPSQGNTVSVIVGGELTNSLAHFDALLLLVRCYDPGHKFGCDTVHAQLFRQKLLDEDGSVRRGVVMVKQPGLFSPKFGATS